MRRALLALVVIITACGDDLPAPPDAAPADPTALVCHVEFSIDTLEPCRTLVCPGWRDQKKCPWILDHHYAFKRMETDHELRKRLPGGGAGTNMLYGTALDDYAWTHYNLQRRIVEDVA